MNMRIPFRSEGEAKRLPRGVREYMTRRFIFLPEYLDLLRCFEYDGVVNEKQVRRVRIFSPNRAREQHISIRTNLDLEQHPEMLLFEGYVDRQGNVYVADRRSPIGETPRLRRRK
jgi:hypothetical protein